MATKKTTTKVPAKKQQTEKPQVQEQESKTPSLQARIDKLVDYEGSKIKAFASVNIGGAFAIHGLRVIDSDKGLFVAMPSTAIKKDGNTEYQDTFHPVTGEARTELNKAVLEAYEQKLQQEQTESEGMGMEEDDLPFTQSM